MSFDTPQRKVVLMLFSNNLRLHDNTALQCASALAYKNNGYLICAYAGYLSEPLKENTSVSTRNHQAYYYPSLGKARTQFLLQSLYDLNDSLEKRGNTLLWLEGNHSNALQSLNELIDEHNVTDICISNTADYNEQKAYQWLQKKHPTVLWHESVTATLFDQCPVNDISKSFTAFRNTVESSHHLLTSEHDLTTAKTPEKLPQTPDTLKKQSFNYQEIEFKNLEYHGGEFQALKHLDSYFSSQAPSTYKATRNALDEWSHSTKFSPWLANGSLSVKVLLNRLREYEKSVIANESTYWIWFELLWREYFYWYAKHYKAKIFAFAGIKGKKPITSFYAERFENWKQGKTPYPIVNACMKQLKQTGYISNRGRQLVASCLVHELGIDWRYGATYFEQNLIDYDVASNWGNWQYLAGVGTDPRGSRKFNLSKQTQQYDPEEIFINKWQGYLDMAPIDSIDINGWPIHHKINH